MTELRTQILQTAQRLFDAYGYSCVSTRQIAGELGISVGNLTYHFHKKSDIANALLAAELDAITENGGPGLAALDSLLRRMVCSLLDHARTFGDPLLLHTLTETDAMEHSLARIRALHQRLTESLRLQQEAGLLSPQLSPQELEDITALLMAAHAGWQETRFTRGGDEAAAIEAAMRAQWTVLRPMLTEKGREELERMESEKEDFNV